MNDNSPIPWTIPEWTAIYRSHEWRFTDPMSDDSQIPWTKIHRFHGRQFTDSMDDDSSFPWTTIHWFHERRFTDPMSDDSQIPWTTIHRFHGWRLTHSKNVDSSGCRVQHLIDRRILHSEKVLQNIWAVDIRRLAWSGYCVIGPL